MLDELTQAIEERDPYTRGHSARVAELADAVARRLGWDAARRQRLRLGGALHDVGKLSVSQRTLAKRGRLNEDELAEIRRHPAEGARLLESIPDALPALPCVLYHHERWDGGGYPTGRAGEQIPVEARLLALADAYDAMTSNRPYRPALSEEEALAEVGRCAGTQFDPTLADAFLQAWSSERLAS